MRKKLQSITFILGLFTITAISTQSVWGSPGVNLNQARNGTDAGPVSPVAWANGNLNGSQAHYVEGMSAPFQCVFTGLTPGVQIYIIIGYDILNSGLHAYDYLTHYNRLMPHSFALHFTPEAIDPLAGTGLAAGTPFSTFTIPAPSSAGSPVAGQPGVSFSSLPAAQKLMTLYNGTIDSMYYVIQGSLTGTQSETQIKIVFTPTNATAVLVWGGHLGSRADWGFNSGNPNSAGGISGSPFHMRLVSWFYGSLGSQDRGLAGGSVGAPFGPLPVELTDFHACATGEANLVQWTTVTEINNSNFTLERSASLTDFHPLTILAGAGNSSTVINYAWTDNAPLPGLSYYRLVQTDFDGTQKIYGPVSVYRNHDLTSLSVITTYPNPFNDNFMLTYFSAERAVTSIEILDATGRQVWYEKINSVAGLNNYRFNNKALPEGIYFVVLSQGKERVTERLMRK